MGPVVFTAVGISRSQTTRVWYFQASAERSTRTGILESSSFTPGITDEVAADSLVAVLLMAGPI